MLSLISVLMVVGCKTEEKENDDPLNGRVIAEKYRGTYESAQQPGTLVLAKDKYTLYATDNGIMNEFLAYTDGEKLYGYIDKTWVYWGIFQENNIFKRVIDGIIFNSEVWTKTNEVSLNLKKEIKKTSRGHSKV